MLQSFCSSMISLVSTLTTNEPDEAINMLIELNFDSATCFLKFIAIALDENGKLNVTTTI